MTRTLLVVALFVAALASGLLMNYLPSREAFSQREVGKPTFGSPMGPYDEQPRGWSASEPMPVGNLPQNVALEENKLMYLANNSTSPECCPQSGLSSDSGCVCLSTQDRKEMNTRFGNR
jgi:hypothetical protein